MTASGFVRLLPWSTPEGKPCYLASTEHGHMGRVADNIESVQLGMASELLEHVAELMADRKATAEELRFSVACLSSSVREVKRIADSRGARLPVPDDDLDAIAPDDTDDGPERPEVSR
ncbi:hypothetical protein [Streptomyces sp. NPDC048527]|uniref:hypothetical protein n=1 Tax=Streptomyces sp. NPDC048527 TaxID=3365568 RepID=UPI00371ACE5B